MSYWNSVTPNGYLYMDYSKERYAPCSERLKNDKVKYTILDQKTGKFVKRDGKKWATFDYQENKDLVFNMNNIENNLQNK